MDRPETLILIMAIAVLSPLVVERVRRWIPLPVVVVEILLGILVGPAVLGWARTDEVIDTLADLGLSMLIFLAGYEINFAQIRGSTLRRATISWLTSLVAALLMAYLLTGGDVTATFVIGTALTSTALGTVLPILRDAGDLKGRFGTVMLAFGAVGEFGPIIAMALLLSGRRPAESTVLLLAFGLVTAAAIAWARRERPAWFGRIIAETLHASGQFAVRFVMLVLACMLGLATVFGVDTLLGAFAAGAIIRLVLHRSAPDSTDQVLSRVESMGYGFLIPVFFVVTGIEFDLDALVGKPLLLLPVFLLLFLLLRGLPIYLAAPPDFAARDRWALVFYGSTCLPLVVAITSIGTKTDAIGTGESAALVGAAMVSVLVFPLVAMRFRARGATGGVPSVASETAEPW